MTTGSDPKGIEEITLTKGQIEQFKIHHKAVAEWGQDLFRGWHPSHPFIRKAGRIMGDILGQDTLPIGVAGYDDKHVVNYEVKDVDEWRRIHENQKKKEKKELGSGDEEEGENDE